LGLEPTVSAGERPQTHALDRAATGTRLVAVLQHRNFHKWDRNAFPLADGVTVGTLQQQQQHCTWNSGRAPHITAQLAVVGDYVLVMVTRDWLNGFAPHSVELQLLQVQQCRVHEQTSLLTI